jgi:hypothetical protein
MTTFKQLALFYFSFLLLTSTLAQDFTNEYDLSKARHFAVTEGLLLDRSSDESFKNEYFISSIHSEETFEVYFEQFNLPNGAHLNVYEGKDVNGKQLGTFYNGKIANLKGKHLTFEYFPAREIAKGNYGFKGRVKPLNDEKNNAPRAGNPASDCVGAIPLCQNLTAVALGGQ